MKFALSAHHVRQHRVKLIRVSQSAKKYEFSGFRAVRIEYSPYSITGRQFKQIRVSEGIIQVRGEATSSSGVFLRAPGSLRKMGY